MNTYYNTDNVPDEFLGQPMKKKKKKKKKKSILGQYYQNQNMVKAWAMKTNTLPGLLTRDKVLKFENRILTSTIPRNKSEITSASRFVNALAQSQRTIHKMNRRLLIDEDDPVRRNLRDDFNIAAGGNVANNDDAFDFIASPDDDWDDDDDIDI